MYLTSRPLWLIAMVVVFCNNVHAATKTWTNMAGGLWTTGSNWSPSGAPAANDDIIIPALTSSTNQITDIPTITLNSMSLTGTGGAVLAANNSGDVITLRNSWVVPSGYTLTIGAQSARLVWTTSTTCNASISGYVAFDAGGSNRLFTINGTLTINSTGFIYDPNPSPGSDLIVNAGATLRTQKSLGFTTTAAPNVAGLNSNNSIHMGGAYTYNTGVNFVYFGTAGQVTGAGLSQNTPASLTVSLTAGQTLTMSAGTTVSGTITMTSGYVNLNSTTLTLGTAAATPGTLVYTAGHLFDGTFARWFTTTAVTLPATAGLFPLGTNAANFRPIWVGSTTNPSAAGIIRASHTYTFPATYITASHNDASWGNIVAGVSNAVWTLSSATIAIAASNFRVRYGGTGFGSNTLTDLDASFAASVVGTHGAATNASTTIEVNRTGLSVANLANAWRLGSRNISASPLPVRLADFSAKVNNEFVDLNWTTYTEKDNDFFTIERSGNGIDFQSVGTVKGAGTSDYHINYALTDIEPTERLNYYRLRQTDFDGTSTLSKIVVVNYGGKAGELEFYPNPGSGTIYFRAKNNSDLPDFVEVLSSDGKSVFHSQVVGKQVDLSSLNAGMYLLKASVRGQISTHKLVISQ